MFRWDFFNPIDRKWNRGWDEDDWIAFGFTVALVVVSAILLVKIIWL